MRLAVLIAGTLGLEAELHALVHEHASEPQSAQNETALADEIRAH